MPWFLLLERGELDFNAIPSIGARTPDDRGMGKSEHFVNAIVRQFPTQISLQIHAGKISRVIDAA
jgi:hypothetical protein